MISRIVVYISRTWSDHLSLYILYVSGARILTAWASIFGMLADRTVHSSLETSVFVWTRVRCATQYVLSFLTVLVSWRISDI